MDHGIDTSKVYPVSSAISAETRLQGMDAYKAMYNASIKNPEEFWRQVCTHSIKKKVQKNNYFNAIFKGVAKNFMVPTLYLRNERVID